MQRFPKLPKPEFLVDRSLGQYLIPEALRALGHNVHTLASIYGSAPSQSIEDRIWLEDAGTRGMVVLSKDDAIRRNPLEIAAVAKFGVKMFCLTTAGLTGEQQRDRIVHNLNRILQRSRKPGPYIYGIYQGGLRRLWP